MRTSTSLIVLALTLSACRTGDPDCGSALVYDRATRACACPEGTSWEMDVEACVALTDGGVDADDASPDSGTTGPITVSALRGDAPQAGLDVVFHDDAGEVVGTGTTGADGSVESPAGSTGVTILDEGTGAASLHSVLGVLPGEIVTFDLPPAEPELRGFTISLPGPVADASEYRVQSPCYEDSAADPARELGGCGYVGREADVIAFATGGNGFLAYAWGTASSTATAVTLGDWQMPVDVALDVQWADVVDGDMYASLLSEAFGLRGQVSSYSAELGVFRLVDDVPVAVTAVGTRTRAGATSEVSFSRRYHPDMISIFVADFGTVPHIETFSADRSEPERPVLTWAGEMAGAGTEAVGTFVYVRSDTYIDWSIHVAPTARSVRMPRLPDEHAALRVTSEVPSYRLSWIDGGAGLSWAAARAHPLSRGFDRTSEIRRASVAGTF